MQEMVAYWIGVFARAFYSFPEFIGNNWPGILLSMAFVFHKTWRSLSEYLRTRPIALGWKWHWHPLKTAVMKTDWKAIVAIPPVFFCWHSLEVAFADQERFAKQTQDLRRADETEKRDCEQRIKSVRELLNGKIAELNQTAAGLNSARDILEQQTRPQRTTIDGCLSQAMMRLAAERKASTVDEALLWDALGEVLL